MRKFLLFLLITAAVLPLSAQEEEWWQGKPISAITFDGLVSVSETELQGIVRPFIGKDFSNSLFWDLQSKLFALDYFEEFFPNAIPANDQKTAVIVEFQVTERPVVSEISIVGNKFLRRLDILDVILLKEGDMVNRTKVRMDATAVEGLYLERGFPDVEVEGTFERNEEANTAVVVFTIDEGAQSKVNEILFSGNSFASENTLKRVLTTKVQSIFSSGVFQESKLAEDIQNIQTYYWDRGYIDARIIDVTREVAEDPEGERNDIIITFFIEEGEQYTYGGMTFEGNTLYSSEELTGLVRQVEGKVLSRSKLNADFARIQDIYANDGYIFNLISMEEIRDQGTRSISYKVKIVEYSRAHIGSIIIEGNEKTKDYVILRELPFEVGDVFSKAKYIEGLRNLYNLQFFSTIIPEPTTSDIEGLMDILISVEEGRTTDIQFGVTFSGVAGSFPVIGFVKWTDKNFMGKGQEFSIGTELSGQTQNLNFSFKDNWLMGRRWSGGIDLNFDHSITSNIQQDLLAPVFADDDPNRVPDPFDGHYVYSDSGEPYPGVPSSDEITSGEVVTDYAYALSKDQTIDDAYLMDYDSLNISLGLSTGYTMHLPIGRLGTGTGFRFALAKIDYDPSLYRPFNPSVREGLGNWLFINRWWLNLSFDTRDIIYNPSEGIYLSERLTYTGGILGGTRDYIRTSTTAEAFATLWDVPVGDTGKFKGVLALHSSIAFILNQIGGAYSATTQDLLYIDGMSIARAWPRVYDGRALWNNWIELRMPILEQYLWGDLFTSAVGIWPDLDTFGAMAPDDFKFTMGGGVRLTIPGFPIGLYLAKRFKINETGVEWQPGSIFRRRIPDSDPAEYYPTSGIDFVIAFTGDF